MGRHKTSFIIWDCESLSDGGGPMDWRSLESTGDRGVRRRRNCDRDVNYCPTPEDFIRHGEAGHCVAVPSSVVPPLRLGSPDPAGILRLKAEADDAFDWWNRIAEEPGGLHAAGLERIRRCLDLAKMWGGGEEWDPAFLSVVNQAVRDGGLPCPECGIDHAVDEISIWVLLRPPFCYSCQTPIPLDLPPGWTWPPQSGEPGPPPRGDDAPPPSPMGSGPGA